MSRRQVTAAARQPGVAKRTERTELQLCIFVRADDTSGGRPLHEVIVEQARDQGLAGATAIVGMQGSGPSRQLVSPGLLRRGGAVPVLIQITDEAALVRAFLPVLDSLIGGGLAVLREVMVTRGTLPGYRDPDQIATTAAP
jgi:PII-like signaling protein